MPFMRLMKRKKLQPKIMNCSDYYHETTLGPPSGDGCRIEISVADNGNGIPQNIIDKIFQPFFTTKPTGQGNRIRVVVKLRHYKGT